MAPTKSTAQTLRELWELLQDYARQETVDPLRQLGRSLGWGLAGAVLVGTGVFFLALAGLRALQTETDLFTGNWTWAPYVIVACGLLLVVAIVLGGVSRSVRSRSGEVEPL